ncbi:MAG: hypothetical protein AB7O45_07710, partial [Alphaproteobacteria bacterium]
MAVARFGAIDQTARAPVARDVAIGTAAGLVALAINLLPLTIGFGIVFHLGGVVAFLLLPRSLTAAAIAGAIAPAWLIVAGDPLAWPANAIEVLAVGLAVRRWKSDLMVADGLFWVIVGLP